MRWAAAEDAAATLAPAMLGPEKAPDRVVTEATWNNVLWTPATPL